MSSNHSTTSENIAADAVITDQTGRLDASSSSRSRLGESAGSLDLQSTLEMDYVSPPETTRPEPSPRVAAWKNSASAAIGTAPTSLTSVMQEQLRQHQQQHAAKQTNHRTFDSAVVEQIQEEEQILLAMAMERSLADVSLVSSPLISKSKTIPPLSHTTTPKSSSLSQMINYTAIRTATEQLPTSTIISPPEPLVNEIMRSSHAEDERQQQQPSSTHMQDSHPPDSSIHSSYDWTGATETLSPDELREIQRALEESEQQEQQQQQQQQQQDQQPEASRHDVDNQLDGLSAEDAAAIQAALIQAQLEDEQHQLELEQQSLQLAMDIQRQEEALLRRHQQQPQGNVRTMTRLQLEEEQQQRVGAYTHAGPVPRHPMEYDDDVDDEHDARPVAAGFRINATAPHEWNRRGDQVIGPDNNDIRTKHDIELNDMANAHRLGLDHANIGNKAYNSFRASLKKNQTKGVAAHGTGRAGSDADATKNGVMDPQVRVLISKAINSGIISRCNGIIKEGKEAVVCHADMGNESEFFDVAVKVFKRISEFKGRADYVQGDPRYARDHFRKLSSRDQLRLWAEKEYRNLVRANRSGVPVPTPLLQKDNVLFMRFLGNEGWPAPQLRELNLRRASKRWEVLYAQVMDAVRKLYRRGRLVHGDLSEYNILVAPAYLVENTADGIEDPQQDVQAVLIDFGQAIDARHPDADDLLDRDLNRIGKFFSLQGVETMDNDTARMFVIGDDDVPSDKICHEKVETSSSRSSSERPEVDGHS